MVDTKQIQEEELTKLAEQKAALFATTISNMIATSEQSYARSTGYSRFPPRNTEYTDAEIQDIIHSGSFEQIKGLSRQYFFANSFYRQVILTYACMPLYYYSVVPILRDKPLAKTKKKYNAALDLADSMRLGDFGRWISFKVLLEGVYYGFYSEKGDQVATVDLPASYCRSLFKGFDGLPIVELDLRYFTSITDVSLRDSALDKFPKEVKRAYNKYTTGKGEQWYAFDEGVGIHFKLFDGRPYFLSSIYSIDKFDDYKFLEIAKEEQ